MSVLKRFALLVVMACAAFSASAHEPFPLVIGPDGSILLDTKTYRVVAIKQRLATLEDMRRKEESDLIEAAGAVHAGVIEAPDSDTYLKELGFSNAASIPFAVMTADSASLSSLLDKVSVNVNRASLVSAVGKAQSARAEMDSIDARIKRVKSQLAAAEASAN